MGEYSSNLNVNVIANAMGFTTGMNTALDKLLQFKEAIAGLAIVLGTRAFYAFESSAEEAADQLGKLATKLRVSTTEAQGWQVAMRAADFDSASFSKALDHMNKAIAGGKIDDLGIQLSDLRRRSGAEQFILIASAIERIPDPAARGAKALEVFGREASKIQEMQRDGLLKNIGELGVGGGVGQHELERMQRYKNIWAEFSVALEETKIRTGALLEPLATGGMKAAQFISDAAGSLAGLIDNAGMMPKVNDGIEDYVGLAERAAESQAAWNERVKEQTKLLEAAQQARDAVNPQGAIEREREQLRILYNNPDSGLTREEFLARDQQLQGQARRANPALAARDELLGTSAFAKLNELADALQQNVGAGAITQGEADARLRIAQREMEQGDPLRRDALGARSGGKTLEDRLAEIADLETLSAARGNVNAGGDAEALRRKAMEDYYGSGELGTMVTEVKSLGETLQSEALGPLKEYHDGLLLLNAALENGVIGLDEYHAMQGALGQREQARQMKGPESEAEQIRRGIMSPAEQTAERMAKAGQLAALGRLSPEDYQKEMRQAESDYFGGEQRQGANKVLAAGGGKDIGAVLSAAQQDAGRQQVQRMDRMIALLQAIAGRGRMMEPAMVLR